MQRFSRSWKSTHGPAGLSPAPAAGSPAAAAASPALGPHCRKMRKKC